MALNIRSIKSKAWLFAGAFALLLIIQFTTRYSAEQKLLEDLEHVAMVDVQMLEHAYGARIATTQVQQWLTDISATRAQDGLDDGFDEARKHYQNFKTVIAEMARLRPENRTQYEALLPLFDDYFDVGSEMANAYIEGGASAGNAMMSEFDAAAEAINAKVDALLTQERESMHQILSSETRQAQTAVTELIVFSLLYAALLVVLLLGIQKALVRPLGGLACVVTGMNNQLRDGKDVDVDLNELDTNESGELGLIGSKLAELVDGLKQQTGQYKQIAAESTRVKQALDVCDTNVMMADPEFNIVYMNNSVEKMMKTAESDLREALPNFDASNLMGQNIDVFHKNPAHQRNMLSALRDVYRGQIKVGTRTFNLIATPIFDDKQQRLGTVVEWDDVTLKLAKEEQEKKLAQENARIKVALDSVTANVMMADADRNIIYANDAVLDTLRTAQSDIRKVLPNFDVDKLMGGSIDQFHVNPQHQTKMLENLRGEHRASIEVGGRHMSLIVNPVVDENNERVGTVVEWADKTAEVAIEREMDAIVAAANDGDLTARIRLEDKQGFFRTLSEGLNTMLDRTSSFVNDMSVMFEALADGDLTKSVTNEYRGEFDLIKTNANNTVAKLTEVMSKVQQSSGSVRTSANEVAQGSDDLSQRTESQASSLEETASSMEEITATVKQTSENASKANGLASEAKKRAEVGGEVVQDAVAAMSEILQSSNKINDIIGVIDEIAFQTNLLALNAAVEAARAGEQGRGFAVVAGEVRTLSQRSAAAAKEIKDLIRDSVSKVESGSTLVNQSGETLAEIVAAVEKVAVMIQDVTNAAMEQNSGISQINQAITQMDEMTQQNAALVEETSAASRAMSEEATNMNNLVSFFKLNGSPMLTKSSAAPAAASNDIKTYSPPSAGPASSGNSDAASFSDADDWEDF